MAEEGGSCETRREGRREGGPEGSKHKHLHFPLNRALFQQTQELKDATSGEAAHRCLVGDALRFNKVDGETRELVFFILVFSQTCALNKVSGS